MPERNLALSSARNNQHDEIDNWGDVEFDRSYRACIIALMRHVIEVLAYIDTVEIYIGGMKPDDAYFHSLDIQIKRSQRARINIAGYKRPWFDPVWFRGTIVGWRYVVNVPTKETLFLLDEMQCYQHVWLHRADISYDFLTDSFYRANALRLHFIRHVILRWCRSPYMPDVFRRLTYWSKYGKGAKRKRAIRNAVAYCDKDPKMRGAFGLHFESRSISSTAVRRLGIKTVSDLLDINPAKHFESQFILAGDFWDQVEELSKHNPRLKHLTQNFRCQLLNKYCRDFKLNRVNLDALRLPTKITI